MNLHGRIGNAVASVAVGLLGMMSGVGTGSGGWIIIIVADMKTKSGRVDVAMPPKEKSTEDRLGHEVEHAIENGFGIRGDDIAAFGETPGNGVQEPEEDGPDTTDGVGAGDVIAKYCCVLASGHCDGPCDPQEGNRAEGKVAPLSIVGVRCRPSRWVDSVLCTYLITRLNQGANQTGDDHDLIDQYGIEDGRPRHAGGQEQIQKQQWGSDGPTSVSPPRP